jgi:DNA primase
VRRHYEIAVRERADRQFRPVFQPRGGRPAPFPPKRGRFPPQPTGPSASLLSNALVRERGRAAGQGPSLSDAVLIGILLRHPEIASARLELLGQAQFTGSAVSSLAAALASALSEHPGLGTAELAESLGRQGHGPTVDAVFEKLRRMGLGGLAEGYAEHAASVWDDAAHLRLRAGALSIERQAAAQALGRETSDIHLVRLRDIQEQVSRSLRPDDRDETEDAGIVHPFKRR